MKTRRGKFLSMTAIVIAAVAALAPEFTPRPTDTLLGRATRLGPIPSYAASFCHFLDDRTVLTAMRNNIHAVVMFDSETGRGVPQGHFVPTCPTPAEPFTGRLTVNPDETKGIVIWANGVDLVTLSDLKVTRIVTYTPHFVPVAPSSPQTNTMAAPAGAMSFPSPNGRTEDNWSITSAAWTRDGRNWFESEDHSESDSVIRLRDLSGRILKTWKLPQQFSYPKIMGVLANGDLLLYCDHSTLTTLQILIGHAIFHSTPALCFWGEELPELELSPDGSRLLWYGIRKGRPSFPTLVAARLNMRPDFPFVGTLYVSDLDGTHLRVIGSDSWMGQEVDVSTPAKIAAFQWTPDGRHVTFIHDRALWRMPVP